MRVAFSLTAMLLIAFLTSSIIVTTTSIKSGRHHTLDKHNHRHRKKHRGGRDRLYNLGKNGRHRSSAKRAAAKKIKSQKYNDYYMDDVEFDYEYYELRDKLRELEELLKKEQKAAAKSMTDDKYYQDFYSNNYDIVDFKRSDDEYEGGFEGGRWTDFWSGKQKKAKKIKDPKKQKVELDKIEKEKEFVKKTKPYKNTGKKIDPAFNDGASYQKGASNPLLIFTQQEVELQLADAIDKTVKAKGWTKCTPSQPHKKWLNKAEVKQKYQWPEEAFKHVHTDPDSGGKYLIMEGVYHSTTKDAAGCIKTYGFKTGKHGAMGAGVYFANDPEEAKDKAIMAGGETKNGEAVIKADVFMGHAFEPQKDSELEAFLISQSLWDGTSTRMLNTSPEKMMKALSNSFNADSIILEDASVFYPTSKNAPCQCAELVVYRPGLVLKSTVTVDPPIGSKASDGQTWDQFCDH